MENKINLVLEVIYKRLIMFANTPEEKNRYLRGQEKVRELFLYLSKEAPVEFEQFLDYILDNSWQCWTVVGTLRKLQTHLALKTITTKYYKIKSASEYITKKNGQTKNT